MKPLYLSILILFFVLGCSSDNENETQDPITDALYFPPINSDTWETKSITDLNLAFEKAMESLGRRENKLPKN